MAARSLRPILDDPQESKRPHETRSSDCAAGWSSGCRAVSTVLATPAPAEWTIETVAGNGKPGAFPGDDALALGVPVDLPFGVEIGPDGALYITSIGQHRVLRLDPANGKISSVAGSGVKGYAGDGGAATRALLNEPYEVRFDADENMYFVEMQNHLIRRVDAASGTISTVAGSRASRLWRRRRTPRRTPSSASRTASPSTIAAICTSPTSATIAFAASTPRPARSPRSPATAQNELPARRREGARASRSSARGPCPSPVARCGSRCARATACGGWISIRGMIHHVAGTGKAGYSGDGGPAQAGNLQRTQGHRRHCRRPGVRRRLRESGDSPHRYRQRADRHDRRRRSQGARLRRRTKRRRWRPRSIVRTASVSRPAAASISATPTITACAGASKP